MDDNDPNRSGAFEANRRVAETTLASGIRISTVFLVLNHQFGDGPPLVFESMAFPPDSMNELEVDRYSTWEEALAGHARMVKKLEEAA